MNRRERYKDLASDGLVYIVGGPFVLLFWIMAFPFFLIGLAAEKLGDR